MDDLFDIPINTYKDWCKNHHLPSYTLTQVLEWVTKKHCIDIMAMSNISKANQEVLASSLCINPFQSVKKVKSSDAVKYIFELKEHQFVEAVAIKEKSYETLCISSQSGCPVGCTFCLTGVSGLKKNLTVTEIVAQMAIVASYGHAITHVVFMGMGEPLLNLSSVIPSIDWLQSPDGFHLSKRYITVSTSGYLAGIQHLITHNIHLNLAFSVGSPIPETRKKLMPIETRNPIMEIARLLSIYTKMHNRKLTLEYTLLNGVNDSMESASQLANLALFLNAKVNLINLNPHPKIPFEPVSEKKLQWFKQQLIQKKIRTTVRYSKGQAVAAACGQLGESNL